MQYDEEEQQKEEKYIDEEKKEKHNQMFFPSCDFSNITELACLKKKNINELIYKCKKYDLFLNNEITDETNTNEECYIKYETETKKMIEENDEIMKKNLQKYVNKYNTHYFYNLSVVICTSIKDALSLLIVLKCIEQLMGKKKKSSLLKFENRKIDIDILFFNNFVIFEKNIKLQKEDVERIISEYVFLHKKKKETLELIHGLNEEIEFLCIPHLYTIHRFSVLLCLKDIMPSYKHPVFKNNINYLYRNFINEYQKMYNINLEKINNKAYVLKDRLLYLKEETHIVGILNVNFDSFTDGSLFVCPDKAVDRMFEMINSGVTVIDIGGESSAPYTVKRDSVSERDFVIPVLEKFHKEWDKRNNIESDNSNDRITNITKKKTIISIDTTHYALFKECVEKNLVDVLNDISACSDEPNIIQLLKIKECIYLSVIIMHKRGNPHTMDRLTDYLNVSEEVKHYLINRLNFLVLNGIPRYRIILDVGLGFAKKAEQSIQLLKDINFYNSYPLLLGYSRKRFISYCVNDSIEVQNKKDQNKREWNDEETCKKKNVTSEQHEWTFQVSNYRKDKDPLLCQKIICGGLGVAAYAFFNKVDFVRVHDVLETKAVFDVLKKLHE